MRIITGSAKGRNLKTPKGSKIIRPALSQVREAIFSSLGDLAGKVVLDVFAGTGSLGLEALSRGADQAYFVDNHSQAIGLILENLKHLGFIDKGRVFKRKVPTGLATIKLERKPDVIFCDPPYDKGLIDPSLAMLAKQDYVDENALILIEHTKREIPSATGFELLKQKKFGQTYISYLKRGK